MCIFFMVWTIKMLDITTFLKKGNILLVSQKKFFDNNI